MNPRCFCAMPTGDNQEHPHNPNHGCPPTPLPERRPSPHPVIAQAAEQAERTQVLSQVIALTGNADRIWGALDLVEFTQYVVTGQVPRYEATVE